MLFKIGNRCFSGVNSVHAIVDHPEHIESAATQPLSYVVAYNAGLYDAIYKLNII